MALSAPGESASDGDGGDLIAAGGARAAATWVRLSFANGAGFTSVPSTPLSPGSGAQAPLIALTSGDASVSQSRPVVTLREGRASAAAAARGEGCEAVVARAITPPERRDDALGVLLQRSVLQRKTEAERGRAQSDKAHATRTIALLRNNLKKACDDHLFLGVPLDPVGPIDPADPVGVHAYTASGALPAGVHADRPARREGQGPPDRLALERPGRATAKPSTMFPCWMPPDHVRTLIQLKYPDSCITPLATKAGLAANASQAAMNTALHSDATKRYITRNTVIQLQQLGSGALKSYYPVDP